MESEEKLTTNKQTVVLTYTPWYDHIKDFISRYWSTFILYAVGGFAIFWGLIEAASFFLKFEILSSKFVLLSGLAITSFAAISRSVFDYKNATPIGLENEDKIIRQIAIIKKPFWEYDLIFKLLKNQIEKIDKSLDDVINNRVHIKIKRNYDVVEYIKWVSPRPNNILRMIKVAKQLLIFDLLDIKKMGFNHDNNFTHLVKNIELVKNLYKEVYDYEIERREIGVPDSLVVLHDLQSDWVEPIRDGYKQALDILQSLSTRESPSEKAIEATIVFEEPPKMNAFTKEVDRIQSILPSLIHQE